MARNAHPEAVILSATALDSDLMDPNHHLDKLKFGALTVWSDNDSSKVKKCIYYHGTRLYVSNFMLGVCNNRTKIWQKYLLAQSVDGRLVKASELLHERLGVDPVNHRQALTRTLSVLAECLFHSVVTYCSFSHTSQFRFVM